ncbi:MAG: protein translocase subunit SecF [Rhodospirillales bacterium]|nr:protein translocase subunit SecF [Rhodospirillales bacterium]MCB9995302.1 protein translocase subunit SecF [Rhodospirillales bacterium]
MKGIRLIPEETSVDFIGKRHLAFVLSLVIVIGSLSMAFTKGLNFGIDFTGGTVMEVRVPEPPVLADVRASLNELGLGAVSLQEFGEETDLMVRFPEQPEDPEEMKARLECQATAADVTTCPVSPQQIAINKIRESLDASFGEGTVDYRRTEFVGPQVGAELKKTAAFAVLWSMIGILAYVWFRFEWQFGVAAVVALIHDVIATIGFFAFTQMQFDLSTLAAVLMIAGYSINDTVVVFDRIRENLRKYKKKPLPEVFNMAINQTLSRTILTGLTTLLALVALWAFGGEVIRGFVDALIFGIVIGTFSSIFVASPLLIYLNLRREAAVAADVDAAAAKS